MQEPVHRPSIGQISERGFGMAETMLALAISLILVGIAGATFLAASRFQRANDALAALQEQGHFALDLIGRELRQAGYTHAIGLKQSDLRSAPSYRLYACDGRPFAAGLPYSVYPNVPASIPCAAALPGNQSDSLFVHHESGESSGLTQSGTAELHLADPALDSGATCQGNRLPTFSIDRSGMPTLIPVSADPRKSVSAQVIAVVAVSQNHYFVDKRSKPGIAGGRLMCAGVGRDGRLESPQPLVQGVEDMQLRFGMDLNGDQSVDDYQTADRIKASDWSMVMSVQVCLLMRSQAGVVALASHEETDCHGLRISSSANGGRAIFRRFSATYNLRNALQSS